MFSVERTKRTWLWVGLGRGLKVKDWPVQEWEE